jgi:hypothetical protein
MTQSVTPVTAVMDSDRHPVTVTIMGVRVYAGAAASVMPCGAA